MALKRANHLVKLTIGVRRVSIRCRAPLEPSKAGVVATGGYGVTPTSLASRKVWLTVKSSRSSPKRAAMGCASSSAAAAATPPPVLADGSADYTKLEFKRLYIGQIAPQIPTAKQIKAGSTSTGALIVTEGVIVQRGPFGSFWIRQLENAPVAMLLSTAQSIEAALLAAQPSFCGGIYVCLRESCCSGLLAVKAAGYEYFTFRDETKQVLPAKVQTIEKKSGGAPCSEAEFVYMRWLGAKGGVPAWATSIEGASALIFSPAEGTSDPDVPGDEILLVWEHGVWKAVSGAVDPGELMIDTIRREIREEVGVAIDETFRPLYLGGWHAARARDALVNDHFSMFALRATSRSFQLDEHEIHEAIWVPWRPLLELWRISGGPCTGKLTIDPAQQQDTRLVPLFERADRREVANNILNALEIFAEGRCLTMLQVLEKDQTPKLHIGANALGQREGSGLSYVVDCGSRHTEVHVLRRGREAGSVLELRTKRLRNPSGFSISLGRNVLGPSALSAGSVAEEAYLAFCRQLNSGLVECGKRDGDDSHVFVGATGGVRKLLDDGVISQSHVDRFTQVLKRVCGPSASFTVLSGNQEALCELRAARSVFGQHFIEKGAGRVDIFSGGGATCQFACAPPLQAPPLLLPNPRPIPPAHFAAPLTRPRTSDALVTPPQMVPSRSLAVSSQPTRRRSACMLPRAMSCRSSPCCSATSLRSGSRTSGCRRLRAASWVWRATRTWPTSAASRTSSSLRAPSGRRLTSSSLSSSDAPEPAGRGL